MDNVEELIARGSAALAAGTEAEALPAIAEATQKFPTEARLWQLLGLFHRNLDQLEIAIPAMQRAASLDPASGRIAHALARLTLESGGASLPLFDRALQLSPSDGDLLLSRSAAMLAEGQLARAIEEFDLLTDRNPLWVAGHAALARLRCLAGQGGSFTSSIDRALFAHPQSAELWAAKIDLLIRAEKFGEAMQAIGAAKKAIGAQATLTFNEAICASELGQQQLADQLFQTFAPFADANVASRYLRHLLRTGRADEAARIGESLTGGSDEDHVWPYLSVAWRLLGDARWHWLEGDERLVGAYDITGSLGPVEELADSLRALHTAIARPLDQSVRGGTQTDGPLFARTDPVIRRARQAIADAVRGHLDQLPPIDPRHPHLRHQRDTIRFAGSWSVRLTAGGHHANHVHPQGLVSSALYVVVPEEGERGGAQAGHLALGQPPAELGLDLPPIRVLEPEPGLLALFPSIMWHGTLPFNAGERMTIAFDVAKPR